MTINKATLTINLKPGRDDDLIIWYEQVKGHRGSRDDQAKQLLRHALRLPSPSAAKSNQLDELRHEINDLKTAMSRIPKLLRDSSGSSTDSERLESIETAIQQLAERLTRLETMPTGTTMLYQQQPEQPTNELSQDELQARSNRLKKAKW